MGLATFVGCQSGAERDIVQREMRQQEDQIYALEDYLSEYQQLLCDARNENAMLKRQMVQGQFREGGGSPPNDGADTLPSPPDSPPREPARRGSPTPTPSLTEPDVPALDMSEPAVPPLDGTSAVEPEELAPEIESIEQVAAEVEVPSAVASAVVLSGEVRLGDAADDDAERGPRVLLHVEPVAEDGQLAEFDGRLSLLVLDPAAREKEQQLARWDFAADDLEPLATNTKQGRSYEFPLQLPAEAPANRPLELWVRMTPEDGKKILGRTTLDLGRAGRFASAKLESAKAEAKKPSRPVVKLASAEEPVESEVPINSARRGADTTCRTDSELQQSGWATVKPGDAAKSPASKTRVATEWKMATRPVPELEAAPIVESKAIPAKTRPSSEGERYDVAAGPAWSPERPGKGGNNGDDETESPQEPAWSPTR
jgi:hypothetical protein